MTFNAKLVLKARRWRMVCDTVGGCYVTPFRFCFWTNLTFLDSQYLLTSARRL